MYKIGWKHFSMNMLLQERVAKYIRIAANRRIKRTRNEF